MSFNNQSGKVSLRDSPALDAFSRLRVSMPFATFDQALEFGVGQLFWDTVLVGAGTSAHDGNTSSVLFTVGTGATDSVVRQTFRYHHYRPGKSQLVVMTGVFGVAAADVRRRMGYFDAGDGIFLEQNGITDVAFVRRTSTSGAPVDNRAVQADWNLDRLDGTGDSKLTLDLANGQILVIDLQWLGYGRVRIGFDIGGQIVYAHEFTNSNVLTLPYMKSGSLPLRYELSNLAGTGSSHTLRQSCGSVMQEDGVGEDFGVPFSAGSGTTKRAVTTRRAIVSIRPALLVGPSAKVNRIPIELEQISLLVSTNDCFWELIHDSVFTGTPVWTAAGAQSGVEFSIHGDAAAGALTTPGIVTLSGYTPSGAGVVAREFVGSIINKLPITLDAAGANPKAYSLVITSMGGTSNVAGQMSWREIR